MEAATHGKSGAGSVGGRVVGSLPYRPALPRHRRSLLLLRTPNTFVNVVNSISLASNSSFQHSPSDPQPGPGELRPWCSRPQPHSLSPWASV